MADTAYAAQYRDINFRLHPEKYRIGKGEQGVLMAEPYKSEILPHWRFATEQAARLSARTIYQFFLDYGKQGDFVGMDMARKFLQMGFTRARRYANHPSGRKYDANGRVRPQAADWASSQKAKAASIFYMYYTKARQDNRYKELRARHERL